MQTLANALSKLSRWVKDHTSAAKPDDYEPHEHMDLEPPPHYLAALKAPYR